MIKEVRDHITKGDNYHVLLRVKAKLGYENVFRVLYDHLGVKVSIQLLVAFRTTITEDTHLTLAVIPFKVEANNSLIFLLLQTYEEKFFVSLQSIIEANAWIVEVIFCMVQIISSIYGFYKAEYPFI